MARIATRLGRILHISIAFLALWVGTSLADDCNRAKQIYAEGVTLLNYVERANAFQRAVQLCPSFAEARVNLADSLENIAKLGGKNAAEFNQLLDKAISEYQEALKYKSSLFAAYLGLGDTYRVMGLYGQSEDSYKKVLELQPGNPQALIGLEKIKAIKAQERGGFKKASEIVEHFRISAKDDGQGGLMGFEDNTVVMDRLQFTNILFDEWSAELNRTEAIEQLTEIGKALSSQDLAECDFVVEGHTDNRGGLERNQKLSLDRSESVKAYLTQRFGIPIGRIQAQGFGYSRPRVPNDTTPNMLKNRRVEIVLLQKARKD